MSLRKVEPKNGICPDGYEYVKGHREHTGKYVRDFCRKIPHKRIKMNIDMRYPGNTEVDFSVRQGIHGAKYSQTMNTEEVVGENEDLRSLMQSDWADTKTLDTIDDKRKRRKKQ